MTWWDLAFIGIGFAGGLFVGFAVGWTTTYKRLKDGDRKSTTTR